MPISHILGAATLRMGDIRSFTKISRHAHLTASGLSHLRDRFSQQIALCGFELRPALSWLETLLIYGEIPVKFSDLSISLRLQGILLIVVLGMLAIGGANLWQLRDSLTEDRMTKTQHVVEVAHGVLRNFLAQERAGTMTRAEAQAGALAQMKSLRYDSDEYFWVQNFDNVMLMHPLQPNLNGQLLDGIVDPDGHAVFREAVQIVRTQEAGFLHYKWEKHDHVEPVDKISFVQGLPEWGWIIGSGIYLDDVDALFAAKARVNGVSSWLS